MSDLLSTVGLTASDIWLARKKIASFIRHTPLVPSHSISNGRIRIYLKLENLQDIGSFKVRGAANAILHLGKGREQAGVATFSTGNHGLAVAHVAKLLDIPAVVFISQDVPPAKVNMLKQVGADIRVIGHSQDEAEVYCYQVQSSEHFRVIKPFDDPHIIAGQGTIGLELLMDLPSIDTAIVPLSGGGLLAGILIALKANSPLIRVIGVSMENGAAMYESIRVGKPVTVPEAATWADSLRGGIGLDNQYTFQIVKNLVDDIVLVPEPAILDGIKYIYDEHGILVEGAAGIGVGAVLYNLLPELGNRVAIIVSGQNVEKSAFTGLL